jgi:3-oxoacyl-[acyl-carrier-protein] synthase-3
MSACLLGFGCCLPEPVVTNVELAARVGRTPEWIEQVSGIRERRVAPADTSIADLAVGAAQDCLRRCGASPESIGMLILASGSAAAGFPGPAAEVAWRLALGQVPALDLPIASAGALFGLDLARRCASQHGDVLVVAAEKMSLAEPRDPGVAVLFGDGAGAALVSSRPGPWVVVDSVLHSDGQYRQELRWDPRSGLVMDGRAVILQASRKLPAAIQEVLARQSLAAQEVSVYLLHQANLNLLALVARTLGVGREKMFTNLERYGNTSSASLLIAAAEWSAANPVPPGPVVLAAFGAGFHWGALVARPAQ